ncbi:MAG: DUF5011 domain-containing protein [Candidatus Latescibacteria bacterium]|nr:DUF5011 domain-containing protein [Candidatus Latescibacterota bacterium]
MQDTTPPTITLNGANPLTLECPTPYVEPGATATDACDGDLTAAIVITGNVDTQTPGTYTRTYTVTDSHSNQAIATRTVQVVNQPPIANAGGPYSVDEGGTVTVAATGSDPDGHPVTFTWDLDHNGSFETPGQSVAFSAVGLDGPSTRTITVRVTDRCNVSTTAQTAVTVQNVAPTVGAITAPIDPISVNTPITASASFSDPGTPDTHTAEWSWGDGTTSAGTVTETNGSGAVSGTHAYTTAGVYTVKLTVTDDDGGAGEAAFQFVVIYDPSAGFVTGGGWFTSPPGAYPANPTLTGKATVGFVSKYLPGATIPSGNTQFQFKAGDLTFKSTQYEWLVVAGAQAKFKGSGTINGSGSYTFQVSATDGQVSGGGGVDKFRIKIQGPGGMVYDNQSGAGDDAEPTTALEGGSIVIHKNAAAKPVVAEALPTAFALKANRPNPFNPTTQIAYEVPQQAHVMLVVFNLLGQEVVRLVDEPKAPGRYGATWDGRNAHGQPVASGVYLYRLTTSTGFSQTRRMTMLK